MFRVYVENSKVIYFNWAQWENHKNAVKKVSPGSTAANRDNPNTGHTDIHFTNIITARNATKKHTKLTEISHEEKIYTL